MRASIPTRQLRSRRNRRVRSNPNRARSGVPVRYSPTRFMPNASIAWSLAAVPKPRSPTTVPGGRPVTPMTRWTAGTSWGASGGLPRWSWWSQTNPRSSSATSSVSPNSVGRLVLADRAGVRVGQRHQPVGNDPVTGQPLVGLGQQPLGRGHRLLEFADQPTQPPIARSASQATTGVARHHLHLPQGVPRDRRDLAGEPIHLRHRHLAPPPQRPGQLLHPPPSRASSIAKRGPAGRPSGLDPGGPAHQACGPHPPAGRRRSGSRCRPRPPWCPPAACGPAAACRRPAFQQGSVQLLDHLGAGPADQLDQRGRWGTGRSRPMRQNRRHPIESLTSRHRLS
jgi:hypothetical protein